MITSHHDELGKHRNLVVHFTTSWDVTLILFFCTALRLLIAALLIFLLTLFLIFLHYFFRRLMLIAFLSRESFLVRSFRKLRLARTLAVAFVVLLKIAVKLLAVSGCVGDDQLV